jgi:hypothetical protein
MFRKRADVPEIPDDNGEKNVALHSRPLNVNGQSFAAGATANLLAVCLDVDTLRDVEPHDPR